MASTQISSLVSLIFIISLSSQVYLSGGAIAGIADISAGGSKCPGTVCRGAPPGTVCEARYLEDDECCPRWICANGQFAYGRTSAASQSWNSVDGDGTSSGYSYSSGSTVSDGAQNGEASGGPQNANGNGQTSFSSSFSSSSNSQSGLGQGQQQQQSMNFGFGGNGAAGGVVPGQVPIFNGAFRQVNNPFLTQQAAAVAMFGGGGGLFGR